MLQTSFPITFPTLSAAEQHPQIQPQAETVNEDMSLTLNTAFVRSRAPATERNLAAELALISSSPACRAIHAAVQQLAKTQNLSELEAAEQVIHAFRKLDEVWDAYLRQEGMAQLSS
jgi:hypothetical protein